MSETFSVWFLIGAALVFWMQAGFAMVEAGFTRSKNTGNIIMKNLMDFCIGTCTFILIGFSLLLGEDLLGFIGKPGFDIFTSYANFDFSNFVFNLVFCATTATIVSGAMAERTNSYLIVFIQELFQHLFIQLKLIGFGVVDGYHNLDSMILLDHVQFIWLVVSLH
jgi:ammonia channel protein AmtB